MKKIMITFLAVLWCSNIMAQNNDRKGYIGLMLGPSFPYDNFSSQSNIYDDGYAKTGLNINLLTFGYKIFNHLGITGSWLGIANPIDRMGNEGMWSVGALMAGPMYSIRVNEIFDLDIKGMYGFVLVNKQLDGYETSSANGTGYEFGMMLHYNYTKNWCLLMNFETFNTRPDIQPDIDPKIFVMNLSFGIAYRLK